MKNRYYVLRLTISQANNTNSYSSFFILHSTFYIHILRYKGIKKKRQLKKNKH